MAEVMRTRTTRETEGSCVPPAFLTLLRSDRARNIDVRDVLATVVADGSNHALLVPVDGRAVIDARTTGDVLRTESTRNETGLLMPYYRTGAARPTSDPVGTLTTRDRYGLVPNPTIPRRRCSGGAGLRVSDADARRDRRGMAFPPEYILLGTKREKVRLAGNAVTPPVARDLGHAIVESLTGGAR